jgi:DNA-directed RNA polymerase specialized sigma24 family protein
MKSPAGNPDILVLWTALHSGSSSVSPIADPVSVTPREILAYLQELPDPLGRVIQLRYLEHQSIASIAISLHCSKRAVRNFLDKGLHRVRKRFNSAYQDQLNTIKKAHALPGS